MYKYEFITIAVPESSELSSKFIEFMNNNAGNLWVGRIGIEVEKEEDIEKVLEKYVKDIHGMEEKVDV